MSFIIGLCLFVCLFLVAQTWISQFEHFYRPAKIITPACFPTPYVADTFSNRHTYNFSVAPPSTVDVRGIEYAGSTNWLASPEQESTQKWVFRYVLQIVIHKWKIQNQKVRKICYSTSNEPHCQDYLAVNFTAYVKAGWRISFFVQHQMLHTSYLVIDFEFNKLSMGNLICSVTSVFSGIQLKYRDRRWYATHFLCIQYILHK